MKKRELQKRFIVLGTVVLASFFAVGCSTKDTPAQGENITTVEETTTTVEETETAHEETAMEETATTYEETVMEETAMAETIGDLTESEDSELQPTEDKLETKEDLDGKSDLNETESGKKEGTPQSGLPGTTDGQIHYGYATYYGAGPGGCCNLDEYENVYYTVAMNKPDYNAMNLAGAYLEVTDKDGDKINVMVTNELPEGSSGDLDLSTTAFGAIEPMETGKMQVSWKIIALPTSEPIYYKFKSGSSEWWVEVQVRNHRYPIKSVEYLNPNGEYVKLERKEYNYYCAPSGLGSAGPYTFRVTDMYGHVLVDENIPLDTSESLIPGKANFPY